MSGTQSIEAQGHELAITTFILSTRGRGVDGNKIQNSSRRGGRIKTLEKHMALHKNRNVILKRTTGMPVQYYCLCLYLCILADVLIQGYSAFGIYICRNQTL